MAVRVSVKKRYGDFALDADFASCGRRTGILGASGCGKSLTLKSIAGLIRPDSGSVIVNERVLFDSKAGIDLRPQKRRVGYMFQEYALFPNMTVYENISVAFAAGPDRTAGDFESVEAMLDKFALSDVRDHLPSMLSGGQKQRCALARMLAAGPQLLLLDEPFSAMDAFLREGMRLELIRILDEYNRDVIIVSHDRDELYQMCDRLVLMDNGRVIAEGGTEDVFKDPGTVAAAKLTGCKNISRIERLGPHRIRALDWGDIELATERELGDDITHIGIRAHDLIPGECGENVISCGNVSVSKMPFEWYVTLENGLWWKLSKDLGEEYSDVTLPSKVSVLPERIILLHDR